MDCSHPQVLSLYLSPQTAQPSQSIWRGISETAFRTHICELGSKTKGVPKDFESFPIRDWQDRKISSDEQDRILSVSWERRLADDFAYVAAANEGAAGVTAVCIEESTTAGSAVVRCAANGGVDLEVKGVLDKICAHLSEVAQCEKSVSTCQRELLQIIVALHRQRIHARLRSKQWSPPPYYKRSPITTLPAALRTLFARGMSQNSTPDTAFRSALDALCSAYEEVDNAEVSSKTEQYLLERVVRKSHALTRLDSAISLEAVLTRNCYDARIMLASKDVRQIEKLGAYCRIATELPMAAKRFKLVFSNLHIHYVVPYSGVWSNITFQNRRGAECYVHAEVQLIAHYALRHLDGKPHPRVIGCSRAACYLCHLFISYHNEYFVSQTHGRLYDQWTLPDVGGMSDQQIKKYRKVVSEMDHHVRIASRAQPTTRPYPAESRQHLDIMSSWSGMTSSVETIRGKSHVSSTTDFPMSTSPSPAAGVHTGQPASLEATEDKACSDDLGSARGSTKPQSPALLPVTHTDTPRHESRVDSLKMSVLSVSNRRSQDRMDHLARSPSHSALHSKFAARPSSSKDGEDAIVDSVQRVVLPRNCDKPDASCVSAVEVHTLTSSKPGYISLREREKIVVDLIIETEAPSSGLYSLEGPVLLSASQEIRNHTDCHALQYGEEKTYVRNDGDSQVELNLGVSQDYVYRLLCLWDSPWKA